jgi:hypothetical protein
MAMAAAVIGGGALAQVGTAQVGTAQDNVQVSTVPTMQSIELASRTQDYTVEQLRRFRDEGGNVVTVRERLEVDASGTSDPKFTLTFVGVVGEAPGSPLTLEWQHTYARFGSLFFRHGGFRIRDLLQASSNYSLHDFGPVLRANRAARRMVVFPNTADKAIWLIDFDTATNVPLFVAEFGVDLSLFAEIEAVSFTGSVQPIPSVAPPAGVTVLADFAAASSYLGRPPGLIDPNVNVVGEYELERIEVRDSPLNGQQTLVMTYTDGIDQFLVMQTVGSQDPFAALPGGGTGGHTIARFRDPALSALFFWEDGVVVHIAGRGALRRLDQLARVLYLQALST